MIRDREMVNAHLSSVRNSTLVSAFIAFTKNNILFSDGNFVPFNEIIHKNTGDSCFIMCFRGFLSDFGNWLCCCPPFGKQK